MASTPTRYTPSPKAAQSVDIAALIAAQGGLFIPIDQLDDGGRLASHFATYDVKPIACGEVMDAVPPPPPPVRFDR